MNQGNEQGRIRMERKYLAFDIETAKPWPDGADWTSYRPLGICCAATLPADADSPRLWHGVAGNDLPADRMSRQDAAEHPQNRRRADHPRANCQLEKRATCHSHIP